MLSGVRCCVAVVAAGAEDIIEDSAGAEDIEPAEDIELFVIDDSVDEALVVCDDIADELIEDSIIDDDDASWASVPVARTAAKAVLARSIRIIVGSLCSTSVG